MTKTRLALVFVLVVSAIGCGGDSKQKALKNSLMAVNAARDGFIAWDKNHQQRIVANAKTLEEGKSALASYREEREPVLEGFTVTYSALAAAALSPSVEMIVEASKAASALYAMIKGLTGDDQ